MPQFDDTPYTQLTAPARGDIQGVIKDVSEALPENQTKFAALEDLLKYGAWASKVRSVTASAAVTLADTDPVFVEIDPNGSDRDVNFPAKADDNHGYFVRHSGSANTLTLKRSGGATVATLAAGEAKYIMPSTLNDFSALAGGAAAGGVNGIINGTGEVNQRVTAHTLVKDVYGCGPDRFYGMATGTAVSAGTLEQTAAANCGSSGYAFKFAGVTLTGTGVLRLRYRMKAKDAVQFKNQTASFQSQVYHDVGSAINYTVYVRKPTTTADTFSAVTDISNSGAISVPNTTDTPLQYLGVPLGDCSKGIEIEIKIECGAITTKNFEFTEIYFGLGSTAVTYPVTSFDDALIACMVSWEKSYDYATAPGATVTSGAAATYNDATTQTSGWVGYKARKRTAVTPTFYSPVTGASGKIRSGGADVSVTGGTFGEGGIGSVSATLTAGITSLFHWVVDNEL